MSFQDIKENWTEIQINGEIYKISYDFNAIAKLEELFNSSFSNLPNFIVGLNDKGIEDIIQFCYIGFLKYQPDLDIQVLKEYQFPVYLSLQCITTFTKSTKEPDEWAQLVAIEQKKEGQPTKKKVAHLGVLGSILKLFNLG